MFTGLNIKVIDQGHGFAGMVMLAISPLSSADRSLFSEVMYYFGLLVCLSVELALQVNFCEVFGSRWACDKEQRMRVWNDLQLYVDAEALHIMSSWERMLCLVDL